MATGYRFQESLTNSFSSETRVVLFVSISGTGFGDFYTMLFTNVLKEGGQLYTHANVPSKCAWARQTCTIASALATRKIVS